MNGRVSLPFSLSQQGIWALQKMYPETTAFNCPVCIDFDHNVDIEKLRLTCARLADRHAALRVRLQGVVGHPRQYLAEGFHVAIFTHNASILRGREVDEKVFELLHSPIDLDGEALWRVHVLELEGGRTKVLFVVHHIIFDGTSAFVLIRSFLDLYASVTSGMAAPQSVEPKNFFDHLAMATQPAYSSRVGSSLTYWRKQLLAAPDHLMLLPDLPRSKARVLVGRNVSQPLLDETIGAVAAAAKAIGVYQSVIYLSAFFIVLSRHSGQDDLTLGMPFDERSSAYQSTIGFFVNMLPIRAKILDGQTFSEFARTVQRVVTEAMVYSHPFNDLVRKLELSGTDETSPIFQHAFMYQNFVESETAKALEQKQLLPLGAQLDRRPVQTGEYEISLEVFDAAKEGRLILKYNPDLFLRATAEALLDQVANVISSCVSDPDLLLEDVALVRRDCNRAGVQHGIVTDAPGAWEEQTIFELFSRQVKLVGKKAALKFEGQVLTYEQLSARIEQIAASLGSHGVVRGTIVAVCLQRSTDLIASIMAILKCGAAYVPLDPSFPAERLAAITADSLPHVLVTDSSSARWLAGSDVISKIDIHSLDLTEGSHHSLVTDQRAYADDLAYVMYTSGTTGRPKGVMVSHGAVMNFARSIFERPGFSADDRIVAVTTYSFDISVLELILPLLCGAECVIASKDVARDPALLKELIARVRPSIMQATPTTWTMLLESGWQNSENIRVLCGGEAMPLALARAFKLTGSEVWNMYGPTETTIWSAAREVRDGEAPLVGGPLANTYLYVLDRNYRPVPSGVPGQLFIGGFGLARGYFAKPGLTASKFLPSPFRPSERMYATGDLVRWRQDGSLDFLGRIDQQVKIRGFRIEVEEIEETLREIDGIVSAAVGVSTERARSELIAYVVTRDRTLLDEIGLKSRLKKTLPDYMIPAFFVQMENLPLTPNGKIDRKALRNPVRVVGREGYVAPRTPREAEVAKIWAELLEVDRIGIEDNFFDLGGHSIAAVQMVARVREVLGVELNMRAVFDAPTIKEFSEYTIEHRIDF